MSGVLSWTEPSLPRYECQALSLTFRSALRPVLIKCDIWHEMVDFGPSRAFVGYAPGTHAKHAREALADPRGLASYRNLGPTTAKTGSKGISLRAPVVCARSAAATTTQTEHSYGIPEAPLCCPESTLTALSPNRAKPRMLLKELHSLQQRGYSETPLRERTQDSDATPTKSAISDTLSFIGIPPG